MADVAKPVEVAKTEETVAVPTAEPAVEAKPIETTEAPAVEAAATTSETPAADAATEAPAAVEEAKKEITPIEEGHLEIKGTSFPKNLLYSKQHFWFGSDAVEKKSLGSYLRAEKSAETGHHNASWASHTGKGLLFFGDKSSPTGVVNLADATEPAAEGSNKFHFISKGHKHAFKAPTAADRDNWVAQLKLKIAEAKELAATVTESEAYKSALESFKPAKKEEPVAEAAPAVAAAAETPATAETAEAKPAEDTAAPAAAAVEEAPKEEPKRRSASRKRTSIFGSLLGKKDEKKEEKAVEAAPAAAETPAAEAAVVEPAAEVKPAEAVEAPAAVTEPAADATETLAAEAAAVEDKPAEAPKISKRNSIFGALLGKKEKKPADTTEPAAPAVPAKEDETAAAVPATTETAPVIPPVETASPLTVPEPTVAPLVAPESTEAAPATNGTEAKKEVKSEKRKSSLPFAFGSKKSPVVSSDEEGEEKKQTAFSKLRATIKGRGKPSGEKKEEKVVDKAEEKPADEVVKTEPAAEAAKPEEPEIKAAPVAVPAPTVTASA